MTTPLDDLRRLGEQLRQAFADERLAIAKLDHVRLAGLADTKRELVVRLSSLPRVESTEARELLSLLRVEARATAMLASTANTAVRLVLGYEPAPSYDRRARQVSTGPSRILATY